MTDKKDVPIGIEVLTVLTGAAGLVGVASTPHGREILTEDTKAIQAGISHVVARAEDALIRLADKLGGAEAMAHERAALNAINKGHLRENLTEASRADAAVVAHVMGHDKPLATPANPKSLPSKPR
jgi:hypothetical protein